MNRLQENVGSAANQAASYLGNAAIASANAGVVSAQSEARLLLPGELPVPIPPDTNFQSVGLLPWTINDIAEVTNASTNMVQQTWQNFTGNGGVGAPQVSVSTREPNKKTDTVTARNTVESADSGTGNSNDDNPETELGILKVKTMFKMVEEVNYPGSESGLTCQMLYLTNKQAMSIPMENMPRVRLAMDIQDPQLVIRLLPSRFGRTFWQALPFWNKRFPQKSFPEETDEKASLVERQLVLLAKEVLLPLAMKSKALVIGTESCSLAAAFMLVSAPVRRAMGKDCPFRVVLFTRAYFLDITARQEKSNAYAFRQKSRKWLDTSFNYALSKRYGDDPAFFPREDIFQGASQCIIFECLSDNNELQARQADQFQNNFISSLQQQVPILALQTYGEDKMDLLPAVAEHVNRGMPLLLVDSRERSNAGKVHSLVACRNELENVCDRLHDHDKVDMFTTSMMAFVKYNLDKKYAASSGKHKKEKQSKMWLWQAIERKEGHANKEKTDNADNLRRQKMSLVFPAETLAEEQPGIGNKKLFTKSGSIACHDYETDLAEAVDLVMGTAGGESEWEGTFLGKRAGKAISIVEKQESWEDLRKAWEEQWIHIRGCCFHKYEDLEKMAAENDWCYLHDFKRDTSEGRYKLMIKPPENQDKNVFKKAKDTLLKVTKDAYNYSLNYNKRTKTKEAFMSNQDKWLAAYNILKSEHVKTGSLFRLKECNEVMESMTKLDRLPTENTPQTLVLLRCAWTLVDLFHARAKFYKVIAKSMFIVYLWLSTATVVITALGAIYPAKVTDNVQQKLLLVIALVGSFVAGWTTFLNPASKWLLLRAGALSLESEIWKFRARTGPEYTGAAASVSILGRNAAEKVAEQNFQATMSTIRERVLQGASLKSTNIFAVATSTDDINGIPGSKTNSLPRSCCHRLKLCLTGQQLGPKLTSAHFRHAQYKKDCEHKPPSKGQDNFHSPITPHQFVSWRLVPEMEFYQNRIPTYNRRKNIFQVFLLGSSALSTLLAAVNQTKWTAIVAALSGALCAWQEFSALSKKLVRYSGIAESLGQLLLWWQALPDAEQNDVKNIENLVKSTEGMVSAENSAWLSDAHKAAKKFGQMESSAKGSKNTEKQD